MKTYTLCCLHLLFTCVQCCLCVQLSTGECCGSLFWTLDMCDNVVDEKIR